MHDLRPLLLLSTLVTFACGTSNDLTAPPVTESPDACHTSDRGEVDAGVAIDTGTEAPPDAGARVFADAGAIPPDGGPGILRLTVDTQVDPVVCTGQLTFSGTKTERTAVRLNGQVIVPMNDELTWTATVVLEPGENQLWFDLLHLHGLTGSSHMIYVEWDVTPPPQPVLSPFDTVTSAPAVLLQGDKEPRTSIEIDGVQEVAPSLATTWSATLELDVGVNRFSLVSRDPCQPGPATQVVIERTP